MCRHLCLVLLGLAHAQAATPAAPTVSLGAAKSPSGSYTLTVGDKVWFESPGAPTVCVGGKQTPLSFKSTAPASGTDERLGAWTGTRLSYGSGGAGAQMELLFKNFASGSVAAATATFPQAINTKGCGSNKQLSTHFPEFSTTAAEAAALHMLSWRGGVVGTTAASKGLGKLGASGLDCGPVVATDPATGDTLVVSTLDHHKIFPQQTTNGSWSMGLAAAIPAIPAGFNHVRHYLTDGRGTCLPPLPPHLHQCLRQQAG
jgi:hypothetical protein